MQDEKMIEMQIEEGRLLKYSGNENNIIIPSNVTTIGKCSFFNNDSLVDLTIPTNVVTISDKAFAGCKNLKRLTIMPGLRRLGNGAFSGCKSLKEVVLPDSVVSLHKNIFSGCTGLESVTLSKEIGRNIESNTFANCIGLKCIVIPEYVNKICKMAFYNCTSLENIVFNNNDIMIEDGAFDKCTNLPEETKSFIMSHIFKKNVINIASKANGAAGALSNFTERHFIFDDVRCNSIEGVLQSFKCPDTVIQRELCLLAGKAAKHAGEQYNDWIERQTLFWNGIEYPRKSDEYQLLLNRLYDCVYEKDEHFRQDLASIGKKRFDHRMGNCNKEKTVLTRSEFIGELRRLIRKSEL